MTNQEGMPGTPIENPFSEIGLTQNAVEVLRSEGDAALLTVIGGMRRVFAQVLHPDKSTRAKSNEHLSDLLTAADSLQNMSPAERDITARHYTAKTKGRKSRSDTAISRPLDPNTLRDGSFIFDLAQTLEKSDSCIDLPPGVELEIRPLDYGRSSFTIQKLLASEDGRVRTQSFAERALAASEIAYIDNRLQAKAYKLLPLASIASHDIAFPNTAGNESYPVSIWVSSSRGKAQVHDSNDNLLLNKSRRLSRVFRSPIFSIFRLNLTFAHSEQNLGLVDREGRFVALHSIDVDKKALTQLTAEYQPSNYRTVGSVDMQFSKDFNDFQDIRPTNFSDSVPVLPPTAANQDPLKCFSVPKHMLPALERYYSSQISKGRLLLVSDGEILAVAGTVLKRLNK